MLRLLCGCLFGRPYVAEGARARRLQPALATKLIQSSFDATFFLPFVWAIFCHYRGVLPRCFHAALATNLTHGPVIRVRSNVPQCDQRRDTLTQLHCRVCARVLRLSRVHQRQRGPRPRVPRPLHAASKAAGSSARELCLRIKLVWRYVCQSTFALYQTVLGVILRVPLSPCELCGASVRLRALPQARP